MQTQNIDLFDVDSESESYDSDNECMKRCDYCYINAHNEKYDKCISCRNRNITKRLNIKRIDEASLYVDKYRDKWYINKNKTHIYRVDRVNLNTAKYKIYKYEIYTTILNEIIYTGRVISTREHKNFNDKPYFSSIGKLKKIKHTFNVYEKCKYGGENICWCGYNSKTDD